MFDYIDKMKRVTNEMNETPIYKKKEIKTLTSILGLLIKVTNTYYIKWSSKNIEI